MRTINTLIGKTSALVILLSLVSHTCYSQQTIAEIKPSMGISLLSQIGADGFGGQYLPGFYFKNGRRSYTLSPIIQNRKGNLAGAQLDFYYSLTNNDTPKKLKDDDEGFSDNLELFVYCSASYLNNAHLGKESLWEESMVNPENDQHCLSGLSFKTAEVFGGFRLDIIVSKNFRWINCLGVGGYKTLDCPSHYTLNYAPQNTGLILRTGISFTIK